MNKTEELLKMANETLSSSKNTNGATGSQAGVVAPITAVVTPQKIAPPVPQQSPVAPAPALPLTGTGMYGSHNFNICTMCSISCNLFFLFFLSN